MSYNLVAPVEAQTELGAGYYLIRLRCPEIAGETRAGQFIMVGARDIDTMLIRRPFSVARLVHDPATHLPVALEMLYRVVGRGTNYLSHLRVGNELAILGPLGRGFWLPAEEDGAELIAVAGGIGSAIFPLLLQQLGPQAQKTTLCFGGRTAADLVLVEWFGEHCGELITATEDGSAGHHGLVTAVLEQRLSRSGSGPKLVMACGPRPMLRRVAEMCLAQDIPCQLALEETMACGFGVCLGCVVPKRHPADEFDSFVRVCTEGPVFDAREVLP